MAPAPPEHSLLVVPQVASLVQLTPVVLPSPVLPFTAPVSGPVPSPAVQVPQPPTRVLRVLYIFAGIERRSDIREYLSGLCGELNMALSMEELDTCRNPAHDVLQESVQDALVQRLESREFDVLVVTPPCSTWSRALFSNRPGPRPCRDRTHPWGYPWLQTKDKLRCHNGNVFVRFSIRACRAAHSAQCKFLLEHPEDLGKTRDGSSPASIFALADMHDLLRDTSASTACFFQCLLGASSCKPTRIVSTLPGLQAPEWPHLGWPTFHRDGRYRGPLPEKCGAATAHVPLIGQGADGKFATSAAAAYPLGLCKKLAQLIISVVPTLEPLREGQSGSSAGPFQFPPLPPPSRSSVEPGEQVLVPVETEGEVPGDATSDEDEFGQPRKLLVGFPGGRGPCLQTKLGGKVRGFCDGAGLCSPGRWNPCNRYSTDIAPTTDPLRKILDDAINKYFPNPDRLVYELSVGRHLVSPFSEAMLNEVRVAWHGLLGPGPWATVPEFQPFYLLAVGETLRRMGDPDYLAYTDLENSFVRGVPVGMGEKMARTPALFSRKVKWRSLDDSEFATQVENYRSTAGIENVMEEQFRSEAEQGMMFELQEADAASQFPPGRFRVAAQGALEKADGSWRVLHDGTHGVQVNNGIRPRDQLAMPGPADVQELLASCKEDHNGVHFGLQADVKMAHRRFKHKPSDWGLLCCKARKTAAASGATVWVRLVLDALLTTGAVWPPDSPGSVSDSAKTTTAGSSSSPMIFLGLLTALASSRSSCGACSYGWPLAHRSAGKS